MLLLRLLLIAYRLLLIVLGCICFIFQLAYFCAVSLGRLSPLSVWARVGNYIIFILQLFTIYICIEFVIKQLLMMFGDTEKSCSHLNPWRRVCEIISTSLGTCSLLFQLYYLFTWFIPVYGKNLSLNNMILLQIASICIIVWFVACHLRKLKMSGGGSR